MAKPALGRGLGELLGGTGATGARAATETRTVSAQPAMDAGLSTLVRTAGENTPPKRSVSPAVLRASLLAADIVLVGGGVGLVFSRGGDWQAVTFASLAVGLGAWLGWLALNLGREKG